jgi:hypothetical protein
MSFSKSEGKNKLGTDGKMLLIWILKGFGVRMGGALSHFVFPVTGYPAVNQTGLRLWLQRGKNKFGRRSVSFLNYS